MLDLVGVFTGEDGAEFVGVDMLEIDLTSNVRDPASDPSLSSWTASSPEVAVVFSLSA